MSTRLPDKPSELLLLALADLEQVEKDDRYVVNMARWHEPNGKCAVCLAGSVMAKTMRFPPDKSAWPSQRFIDDAHDVSALVALNDLRAGELWEALTELGFVLPDSLPAIVDQWDVWPHYGEPDWWNTMLGLVGILQAEGL